MNGINIKARNGIEIISEGQYYFDSPKVGLSGIHCISHAHFDHLPRKIHGTAAICTDLTASIASMRLRREIEAITCSNIRILNSGHVPGASMFLLGREQRILYTGDFSTRTRFGLKAAVPVQTDAMIVEATYGDPQFIFPKTEEVVHEIKDWTEDSIKRGFSVNFFVNPLGKAQELMSILSGYEIFVHKTIVDLTRLIPVTSSHYSTLTWASSPEPSVKIYPMRHLNSSCTRKWKDQRSRTAIITGLAVDRVFRDSLNIDEAFPLSDHADFEELIAFIDRCNPSIVFTYRGRSRRLSNAIRKTLGIDSRPLIKNQTTILDFL